MTEEKPTYEINLISDPAPATPASYWETVAKKERKKADDNLRLAAERATTIQELSEALRAVKADLLKRDENLAYWMSKCAGLEVEIERLRSLLERRVMGDWSEG